ncbi:hypothetical protein [Edaphobacter modestus]|uniref:Secretin/TonB short N-terminal domain-containing protein n=1 Tax=Edaphobacter modestus TaxID=388466 RepID=A0A4Q7YTG8_9BACT|nr:hypothetical protein [Edaphobacter modestus]RZU40239.1 hypothetical protein BDD14_1684 [Edaphobacter modestus]
MTTQTPIRLFLLLCLSAPLAGQSAPYAHSRHSQMSSPPPQQTQAPSPQTPAPSPPPSQTPAASTQLPSTAPTASLAPSQPAPAPTAAPPPPPLPPANHARITYLDHQLTVTADNSSLNQILHEVSQLVGITITGGVAEERVFGSYGPTSPSQILDQLLDGTASNMLFISSTEDQPAQLILTPRRGGPTPPSPSSMSFNERADSDDPPMNPPEPPSESESVATPQQPAPPTPAATPAAAPAATPATSPSGTPQDPASSDPNAVKTPQQIYDQLMKLRQQQ